MIHDREYYNLTSLVSEANTLDKQLTQDKRNELKRIQQDGGSGSTKTSLLYLNILHELQNVLMFTKNLLKVSRKFQME
ncbi:inorganic phosphate transporter, partial [Parabacteroides sp. OttesenSCG-928-G06]|nr:inorganic phosphate transporter [Parabacteroides sp. OttesenSCG-928-G06]